MAPAPAGPRGAATTRERLRASFAAQAPPALATAAVTDSVAAAPAAAPGAVVALPTAQPETTAPALPGLTTRERLRNGALAPGTAAAGPAAPARRPAQVIEIDALRERRRQRVERAAPPVADPPRVAPIAPVAPGAGRPPARAPPAGEGSAATGARAPPVPAVAVVTATSTPAEAAPDGTSLLAPGADAGATPATAESTAAAEAKAATAAPVEAGEAADPAAAGPATEAAAEPAAAPAAAEPATAPVVIRNPEDEPGFQAMKRRASRAAAASQAHQPAAEGAANAQGAALPPANDLESQAAAAQVEVMAEQEPGVFDAQAFIAAVKRAVEAATPSNLEEADEFKESGAVGQATADIGGLVKGGKQSSEQNIAAATEAAPDLSAAVPKPVEEMVNDEPGAPPPGVGAAGAMPGPRPPEQTDLSAGPAKVDAEMVTANVTDEQVARSNEPDFSAALDARQKARDHAATAPAGYRAEEETILAQGRESAAGEAAAGLEGMHAVRTSALGAALAEKEDLKGAHEAEHARVAAEIQAIYDRAQSDVTTILDDLDVQVDDEFTRGEEAARTGFENEVDQRMRAYKADRYSGLGGGARWGWDKLTGMPDEVNSFYEEGRAGYLRAMDTVIEGIATTVGTGLTAARARIVQGRAEVRAYVDALPEDLRALGEETQGKLEDRFDELSSEVDAKQDALVDAVAHRYVESRDALDTRIEQLQAENKGLVAAALDAVVGVIKTILALGEMLLRVLAKAAEVVGDIIADPIGFLSNLIDGVMGGLKRFVARIGTHLQNALVEWLFGTLGRAGLRLPDQLDAAGILDLVTQVIGLTYANVRARVAGVVGEAVVEQMEQSVEVFTTLASTGLGGLWELVSGKLGDLQEMVLGKIKAWVIERVIEGGIAWIIGLLNPVSAFIKACKAIYHIVTFIVDRAKQIMEFVDAILGSISAIAKGDLGAAEEKVEGSLAKGLPLAIGFLASLLGLGDISEKVKSIIAAVRRPVEKAIDTVVVGIARTFKRTFGRADRGAREAVASGAAVGAPPNGESAVLARDGPAARAADPAADAPWVWETIQAGHAIRISPSFEVFRFSRATRLPTAAAHPVQQAALESKVARTPATYPTDALGRAAGPSGFVKDVKEGEKRSSLPAVHKLPGGVAAYEPDDVRGHLIGDRFYGPATGGNLVPMHETLNGSTFLSFETGVAKAYKAEKAAGRGALLSMEITPDYPADDPTNPGRKYRPSPVRAACIVYSLNASGGVTRQPFGGSFTNPSNATTFIDLNTADRSEILAAYSGQLTPDVHVLVDAIIKVRPRRTVDGLALAVAYVLPARKMDLFEALLGSRGTRFFVGRR